MGEEVHLCWPAPLRIEGMDRQASRQLIKTLNDLVIADTTRVYHHHWAPGDFVIWDNRRMYHRAMPFDVTQRRLLLGVRITGDASERCFPASDSRIILEDELVQLRRAKGLPTAAKL